MKKLHSPESRSVVSNLDDVGDVVLHQNGSDGNSLGK